MKKVLPRFVAGSRTRHLLLSVAPTVLPLATGSIMHLLMARSIAPADYAIIPQALALASFATVIAYFINHDVAAREIAISPVRVETTRAFFVGRMVMTMAGLLAGSAAAHVIDRGNQATIWLFLGWFAVSTGLVENLIQSWRANDGFGKSALLSFIQSVLLASGIAGLYLAGATIRGLALVLMAGSLLSAGLFMPFSRDLFGRFDRKHIYRMLARSFPVAASGAAVFISNWFGVLWLSYAGAKEDLAHYFLAGKFAGAHLIAVSVLYFAFIPELSGMDERRMARIFNRWMWAMVAYAAISVLIVYYAVLPSVSSFWGAEYLRVRQYYAIYIPWIICACFGYYNGIFIYASGHNRIIGIFQTLLAVLTVVLTMIVYAEWGPFSLPLAEGTAALAAGIVQFILWQGKVSRFAKQAD